jgi:membrane fusion protein, multidrug efflux system
MAILKMIRSFLATIVAAALLGGCSKGGAEAPPPMPPVFVETAVVNPGPIHDFAELVGQLEAEESVQIRPEMSGIIEEILFEEGAVVQAGALLVRLRDDEQKAELAAAEARERLAADTHRRFHQLAEEQILSASELERVTRELDVARAEVERARVYLDRTRIRAPFSGKLGARRVSPGARVTDETPLVELHATERLRAVFTVPERYASVVRVGEPLEVAVAAHPDEWFPGEVYFVAPTVDPASRQRLLKGWVPNAAGRLWPGQFARVRTEVARRDQALVVPDSALVYDGQAAFVWRVGAERKAERVDVETGLRQEGRIEIRKGVNAGDEVVVAGTNKIFPGATLMAAPPTATAHGQSTSES